MKRADLLDFVRSVLTLPTAPYHEHAVRDFVEAHCRALGLCPRRDAVGNVIVPGPRRNPLIFVAHMDHPGFEALGRGRAEFLGGVPPTMFRGQPAVRFLTSAGWVKARVRRVVKNKVVALAGGAGLRGGELGMWDLPAFQVRGDRLRATAIDDVLGCVVLLAALTDGAPLTAVFTRAEETGFHGALAVAKAGRLSRRSLVVSVEMSRRRPWARTGCGPVVRVGDKATVFDPAAALFFTTVAQRAGVPVQRALMDGGTCEATAFAAHGYRTGGLCLPLGNYHNIGPGERPAAEYVSVTDLEGLVKLVAVAAREWRGFAGVGQMMQQRINKIRREAPRRLVES